MVQRHPVNSYKEGKNLNFWVEFPDFKVHPILGEIYRVNRKAKKLQASSNFMWALSMCYDRVSSIFTQPVLDKWSVASEDLFGDEHLFEKINDDEPQDSIVIPKDLALSRIISAFEGAIDSPLGVSLRQLEKKFLEREEFIMATPYSLDGMVENEQGRQVLVKGTATDLDKMFANTAKIAEQITAIMNELSSIDTDGAVKGGGKMSMSDSNDDF